MLTLQDCLGICELDPDEIDAIALHEEVPEIIACALAEYLIHTEDGVPMIKRMILDDIRHAREQGHEQEAAKLESVLMHFIAKHPEYKPSRRAERAASN